ncbi:ferritin-like domain-containing protein [Sulfurimonas sp. HSL1-6]|uniref:ferritin-like domain-containing protein n=1 Tax=Thiomicrolovo immobilis TaxID=3131935 RepID=UPI0031F83D0F
MQFHTTLQSIIMTAEPAAKLAAFRTFYAAYQAGGTVFDEGFTPVQFDEPSFASVCEIVPPQDVPRRKSPVTAEGQILLLHAITHIEYSAIDLALDHAYRFTGMPKAFYDDWLEVADDECRHFEMLHTLLEALGSRYGALPVHAGLFEAGQKTLSLLERMAVVPRYFEANGLDATPQILERLLPIKNDPMIGRIVDALQVILKEEVDHVRKGDRWFDYACEAAGAEKSVYFDIVEQCCPGSYPRQKYLNVDARRAAGFSCSELNRMSTEKIC